MIKGVLFLAFFHAMLYAAYLPNSAAYTLLSMKARHYKVPMAALSKAGLFSVGEINGAIKNDTKKGLSAFVRAVAYDAAGKGVQAEAYIKGVKEDENDFIKITALPEVRLLLCDIYLRQGRFNEIKTLLPKLEFLLWDDREQVRRAYYYLGMAHYLKTGSFNNDYKIAKNYYPVARDIYNESEKK